MGLQQGNQQLHHFRRGVELTSFLTGAVCEHLDQVFVSSAQQVRAFKVFVAQAVAAEVAEQVAQLFVRQLVLDVEVDGNQHPLQNGVVLFNGFGGGVQFGANVMLQVFQHIPAGNGRYIEGLVVFVFIVRQLAGLVFGLALIHVVPDNAFLRFFKSV